MTGNGAWDRIPVVISFAEAKQMVETYGFAGSQGRTVLEGQRLVPRGRPSDTVYRVHASGDDAASSPDAGRRSRTPDCTCLCAGSRYAKNDSALIMEKVAIRPRHIRPARARAARLSQGGAGRLVGRRLAVAVLPGAGRAADHHAHAGGRSVRPDAGRSLARRRRHLHRGASEPRRDPDRVARSVGARRARPRRPRPGTRHLRRGRCPNKPPFAPSFVADFRAAQLARNRTHHRLGARHARSAQAPQRRRDGARLRGPSHHERRALDRPSIDPNGRKPNWCFLGDPRDRKLRARRACALFDAALVAVAMVATTSPTPRDPTMRARSENPGAADRERADDAVPATHNPAIRAALATSDKEYVEIAGATHYYADQPAELAQCLAAVTDWSRRKGLLSVQVPGGHRAPIYPVVPAKAGTMATGSSIAHDQSASCRCFGVVVSAGVHGSPLSRGRPLMPQSIPDDQPNG